MSLKVAVGSIMVAREIDMNETRLCDYMKAYADQIRCFVPRPYAVLGTDGYGRSDTRAELREFFELSRYYIAVAALKTLADEGGVAHSIVVEALRKFGVDPEKPSPVNV